MRPRAEELLTPTLRANFGLTLAGNVSYAAAQWLTLVLIARLGSPETVGRFTLALATAAPIVLLANLQLRSVQSTDARREYAFGQYLALRLITCALALGAIGAYGVVAVSARAALAMLLAVGLAKVIEALSDVVHGLFQSRERMAWISTSLVLRGVLEVVALAAGSLVSGSVVVGVLGVAVARLVVLLLHDLRVAARLRDEERGVASQLRPRWEPRALGRLAWRALPLGVVAMFLALNVSIPRYVIERHLGEAQLGLFAAMASFTIPGAQVVMALGQAASPRLAKHHADADRSRFRRLVLSLVGVAVALGIAGLVGALVAGEALLVAVYGPIYGTRADVLALLMAAGGVSYVASVLGFAVTATRHFHRLPLPYLLTTGAALVGAWTLIPGGGLTGAALTTGVVAAVSCLIAALLLSVPAPRSGEEPAAR